VTVTVVVVVEPPVVVVVVVVVVVGMLRLYSVTERPASSYRPQQPPKETHRQLVLWVWRPSASLAPAAAADRSRRETDFRII